MTTLSRIEKSNRRAGRGVWETADPSRIRAVESGAKLPYFHDPGQYAVRLGPCPRDKHPSNCCVAL